MAFQNLKSEDWDKNAKEYATLPVEGPLSVPAKKMLSDMDSASPFSSATAILDVGCGPGTIEVFLDSLYGDKIPKDARLIATDYSKGMVECVADRAKGKVAKNEDPNGLWERVEPLTRDAANLEGIPDNSISHVIGSLVYFMTPDPLKSVKEAHRVLTKDGIIGVSSWSRVDWMQWLGEAAKIVRPSAPSGFDPEALGPWKYAEGIKSQLEEAGFRDVQTEYVEVALPVENPEMFVNGFIKSQNPGSKMIVGGFSEEELERTGEEWVKIAKANGNKCTGVSVLGVGRK